MLTLTSKHVLPCPMASLRVSRDGVLISVNRKIQMWDPAAGKLLRTIDDMDDGTRQGLFVFDLSPSGDCIATGVADFTTKVYSTRTAERLARLSKPLKSSFNAAEQIAFSPDEQQLACAKGKKIECFAVGEWTKTLELTGHTSKVHLLRYAPDGHCLASAGGKQIKLWNPRDGSLLATLEGHTKLLASLAFAPDSSFLASGGEDGVVILWDTRRGQAIHKYPGHVKYVFRLAVSPDCTTIASHDHSTQLLCLWNVRTLETGAEIENIDARRLLFSPDGKLLVVCSHSTTRILDPRDGSTLATLPGSSDATFSSKGDWLATAEQEYIVIRAAR